MSHTLEQETISVRKKKNHTCAILTLHHHHIQTLKFQGASFGISYRLSLHHRNKNYSTKHVWSWKEEYRLCNKPEESTNCSPSTVRMGTFLYSDHLISFLNKGFTSTILYGILLKSKKAIENIYFMQSPIY